MHFSDTLKILRESKDVTQQDLAKYLSVSRTTITGYETRNREPDYDKLMRLASYFGVSVDYLIGNDSSNSYQKYIEKDVDSTVISQYRKLTLESKISTMEYIELLQLKEQQEKINQKNKS
ncbi:MAG: helix-turn-helix transcriptional regulator [Lachnospiraceae bacterium]|nr:helix-turn-helix transcriptional regulator [Lachnospiraceae bacterium]